MQCIKKFEHLIDTLLKTNYIIDPNFRIPNNMDCLENHFIKVPLTIDKSVSVIFFQYGFNRESILSIVEKVNDTLIVEDLSTNDKIQKVFKQKGVIHNG